MTWLEVAGTVTGLVCVWLTVKENIWNWPIGVANILVFLVMFFQVKLYGDFLLQVIFLVLQLYGWWYWLQNRGQHTVRPTTRATPAHLLAVLASGAAGWLALGYFLATYTDGSIPWVDAATTAVSLMAQWLLGRKHLESWIFWIIVDVANIGVYAYKGLYLTSGLYAVFLLLAVRGYSEWRRGMCATADSAA